MRLLVPPGVFRPPPDTWMLAAALRAEPLAGRRVLDVCTGSGALAAVAALGGADVTALDVSRRAVAAARLNARLNGVRVRALRGDLLEPVRGERFDIVVSNPPYLPAERDRLPHRGLARATEAGLDGRALLDRVCVQAPAHLRPGGVLLIVHSSLCGVDPTLELLERHGLRAEVAARRRGPLGPRLAARAPLLEARGLLEPGQREEDVVVLAGRAQPSPSYS